MKRKITQEHVIRALRLMAGGGMSQSAMGRAIGVDRHRAMEIMNGEYDHLLPVGRCATCHGWVRLPCQRCNTPRGVATGREATLEVALAGDDAERFEQVRHRDW